MLTVAFSSASFIGLLIYASVIFHKSRKGSLRANYAPAAAGMEPLGHNTAYPSYNNGQKTSYDHSGAAGSYNMNSYGHA